MLWFLHQGSCRQQLGTHCLFALLHNAEELLCTWWQGVLCQERQGDMTRLREGTDSEITPLVHPRHAIEPVHSSNASNIFCKKAPANPHLCQMMLSQFKSSSVRVAEPMDPFWLSGHVMGHGAKQRADSRLQLCWAPLKQRTGCTSPGVLAKQHFTCCFEPQISVYSANGTEF